MNFTYVLQLLDFAPSLADDTASQTLMQQHSKLALVDAALFGEKLQRLVNSLSQISQKHTTFDPDTLRSHIGDVKPRSCCCDNRE